MWNSKLKKMSPFKDVPGVDVCVLETLTRAVTIYDAHSQLVTEYEYEADERCSVAHSHWEHGDLAEAYKNDNRTAAQCLQACCSVLSELLEDNQRVVAGISLRRLYQDCCYWEQANFSVTEL